MKENLDFKLLKIIFGIVICAILIICGLYIANFHNHKISDNPEEWGQFGDYLGGVLNSTLSILNLILITYLTLKIAKIEEDRSENFSKDSVKPFGLLSYEMSTTSLKVELHNVGLGPLILTEFKMFDENDKEFADFKEFINTLSLSYRPKYSITKSTEEGTIIRKDDYWNIIKMSIDENSEGIEYEKKLESINKVKEEISKCKIKISYSDIYGNLIKEETEKLNLINENCG